MRREPSVGVVAPGVLVALVLVVLVDCVFGHREDKWRERGPSARPAAAAAASGALMSLLGIQRASVSHSPQLTKHLPQAKKKKKLSASFLLPLFSDRGDGGVKPASM